jgi:hypothetical protein
MAGDAGPAAFVTGDSSSPITESAPVRLQIEDASTFIDSTRAAAARVE